MSESTGIWELRQGETVIGRLTVYDEDVGWYSALFEPKPAFDPHRALFAEGAAIRTGEDAERWQAWNERVRQLGLQLVRLSDSASTADFLLYIDGRDADFRPRFNT
ncbi:MAG: hypothetical protein HZC41_18610 [Chloroflexi bacterium]|nr:hypothetical protein [Chloroflexota bacterium]